MSKGKFALDLEKFTDLTNGKMAVVVKKSFFELSKEIIETSPVDEGRFRANWMPAVNKFSSEETESTDENRAVSKLLPTFNKYKLGDTLTLTNNLPYAMDIEYGYYGTKNAGSPNSKVTSDGYSKKAPAGVVGINILRWSEYVESQARKLK